MSTADELRRQLQEVEEKEAREAQQKREKYANSLIGRCYKSVDGYGRYAKHQRVNTDHGQFFKVLGIYSVSYNGKDIIALKVHKVDVLCTPVGWVRNNDGTGLRYQMHSNSASMTKTNRKIVQNEKLLCGVPYAYELVNIVMEKEDGTVLRSDSSSSTRYIEIEESEMNWVEDNLADMSRMFYERFCCLFTKEKGVPYPITPETEGIITQFDSSTIKAIDDLLKANPELDLKSLITVAKKEAKYNYFNGITLPELVQYKLHGDRGLNLTILGGDGGTDYEPYTTHYYIDSISIDWPHILYPIRQKLSCGVLELTKKLNALESVYHTSSWECNYSTSSYDASFESARLMENALNDVNELIANHIKTDPL